ncbi:hypothetical protein AB205_0015720 [Aquarana catesbeiana]|uniref:BESS domain-containing protein n=1 Tax=Aquarana catesbeiana TaxID=8400 RepID=A0A2G9Q4D8_AQUCT|nr:hypothetical protein AB205_0015720 [Aquarana catesbeiana]
MYCHYYELEFLKPVMQARQTESNINSESEAEELTPENTTIEPHVTEKENDEEDIRETPLEPPRKSTSKSKSKKPQQTQEFIDVVRNLIDSQKMENNEISAFTKSLIPQIALVKQEYQCDLRIELMKVIKSFQQKSNTQTSENPNPQQYLHYGNPWENSSYRAPSYNAPCGPNMSMTPQFNKRFHAGQYDMPPNYYPPIQAPPPPPPTPPNTAREDSHPHPSFYQDL